MSPRGRRRTHEGKAHPLPGHTVLNLCCSPEEDLCVCPPGHRCNCEGCVCPDVIYTPKHAGEDV